MQDLDFRRLASCTFPMHLEHVPSIEMQELLLAKRGWLAARDMLSNYRINVQLLVSPDLIYT